MSPSPIVLRDFVPAALCQRYVEHLRQTQTWEACPVLFWDSRAINLQSHEGPLREELLDLRVRVLEAVRQAFDVRGPLGCDVFPMVRWPTGCELHPHADAVNPDGSPHPFSYRQWSAILYLNDDYEGGQVYFPKRGFEPELAVGTLIMFTGDLDNLHGVREITKGTRYTISGFFTQDERHHDGYRLKNK